MSIASRGPRRPLRAVGAGPATSLCAALLAFAGATLALAAGCADSLTEIVVVVDSDLPVPMRMDEVIVRASGPQEVPKSARAALTGPSASILPLTVGLVPKDGRAGPVTIRASARRAGADVVATEVRTSFVQGRRLVVRLSLLSSCVTVAPTCGAGQTCRDGRCVDATVDPSTLPPFTGEVPRPDMGPPDAAAQDGAPSDGDTPDGGACTADAQCDDRDACNGRERCVEGRCLPGAPLVCADDFDCTADACDPASGCRFTPMDARCTAGPGGRCDPASGCQYAICDATTCTAGPCQTAACEGALCVRTSTCAAGQACCGGACVAAGCDDGNECTADRCEAAGCVNEPRTGASCSDGNACTTGDACGGDGVCRGGAARSCDDGNVCTDDVCDPARGCANTPNARSCDDGDPCTVGDRCAAGRCEPGGPCNDGVDCTVDACTASGCSFTPMNSRCTAMPGGTCSATSGCQYPTCSSATCSPRSPCETAACMGTTCVRTPVSCVDDGNPCTAEACDPMTGGCRSTPRTGASCDDGDGCTMNDACDAMGLCRGAPRNCDDGFPCTTDTCSGGVCVHSPNNAACDDANPCTVDTCTVGAGCTYANRANFTRCSTDGPFSTCDFCSGGTCVEGDECFGGCTCSYSTTAPPRCRSSGGGICEPR
jgi:hypothetical protein